MIRLDEMQGFLTRVKAVHDLIAMQASETGGTVA
jgi:hypothetical protein